MEIDDIEENNFPNKVQNLSEAIRTQWGRLVSCIPLLDSVDLIESSLVIGRSDECDVVIHKSNFPSNQIFFVSKKHFVINKDPNDNCITYITDLSKNGTYVNDHQIGRNRSVILQNNDFIAIGEKLLVYNFKSMGTAVDNSYLLESRKSKYVLSYLLGKGSCGEVRLAYDKFTCKKFAVKKIIKGRNTPSQIYNVNHPDRINTEIHILQSLSHPLIVGMEEIWETESEVYIVLEYLNGGELSSRISPNKSLSESNVKFFFYQMVLAVQYLHSKGITHRDLKPGNILLCSSDPYSLIKLTDFGLSNVSEDYDVMKTICGTWHYIAPEILNQSSSNYTHQVDIWSLGVILYYMLSKTLPFNSNDRCVLEKRILLGSFSLDGTLWYEISSDAKDLIKKMLVVNPNDRITLEGILCHPWISKDSLMRFKVENMMNSLLVKASQQIEQDSNFENGAKRFCQRVS